MSFDFYPIYPPKINEWLEVQTPTEQTVRIPEGKFQGVEVNENNELVPIPVVYGRRKITGPRIFASVSASNSNILYSAIALSEGPIYGIDGFYLNDEAINLPIASGGVQTINSGSYGGVLSVELKTGAANQTNSTLLTEILGSDSLINFTASVSNMAYLVLKMTWTATGPYKDYPKISVNVQGRKLRNSSTVGFGTEQNVLRDANPADVILDLLTNTRYGRGLADTKIDATSISSLRSSFQTTLIPYRNGAVIPRASVNWAMNTGESTLQNLQDFCRQFGIMMTLSNGKYRFVPEYQTSGTVLTANDTNIIGTRTEVYPDLNVKFNRVKVTFANELNFYNDNTETVVDATAESVDGKILETDVRFDALTSPYLARFAAEQILRKSRSQITYNFTMTKTAMQLTVGDVISYYGVSVRIISMTMNPDLTFAITAVTHNNSFYPQFTPGDQWSGSDVIIPKQGDEQVPIIAPPTPQQGTMTVSGALVLFNGVGTDFYAGPYYIKDQSKEVFDNTNYAIKSASYCTVVANNSYGVDTRVVGSSTTFYYYMFAPYMTNRKRDLANKTLGGEGIVVTGGSTYNKLYYVYEIDTADGNKFGWHSIHNTTNNSKEYFYFDPETSTSVRRVLNGVSLSNLTLLECVEPKSLNPNSLSLYGCPYLEYVGEGYFAKPNDPQLALKYILKDATSANITRSVRNWIIPATVQAAKQPFVDTNAGARMIIKYFVIDNTGRARFLANQNINIKSNSPGYAGNSYTSSSRTNWAAATGRPTTEAPF